MHSQVYHEKAVDSHKFKPPAKNWICQNPLPKGSGNEEDVVAKLDVEADDDSWVISYKCWDIAIS